MPVFFLRKQFGARPYLWLIALIEVIVPRRLRADWRREWEAELRYRERMLDKWDRLDWRNKLELFRRSLSAFWDALVLQPQRLEGEMIQDLRFLSPSNPSGVWMEYPSRQKMIWAVERKA